MFSSTWYLISLIGGGAIRLGRLEPTLYWKAKGLERRKLVYVFQTVSNSLMKTE
jgi:hypothetical protein